MRKYSGQCSVDFIIKGSVAIRWDREDGARVSCVMFRTTHIVTDLMYIEVSGQKKGNW